MAIDRDDPAVAEAILLRACPAPELRKFLMGRLLRSIALAERAGPRSWAVTLFDNGFRLNVGAVEALTYLNRVVRFFMLGALPASAYTLGEVLPSSFRSVPQPQTAFFGSVGELQRLARQLEAPHAAFVEAAATTAAGRPRRTPYARYHSPGLYHYAVRMAGGGPALVR